MKFVWRSVIRVRSFKNLPKIFNHKYNITMDFRLFEIKRK